MEKELKKEIIKILTYLVPKFARPEDRKMTLNSYADQILELFRKQKQEVVEKMKKPAYWDDWSVEKQLGYKLAIAQLKCLLKQTQQRDEN